MFAGHHPLDINPMCTHVTPAAAAAGALVFLIHMAVSHKGPQGPQLSTDNPLSAAQPGSSAALVTALRDGPKFDSRQAKNQKAVVSPRKV